MSTIDQREFRNALGSFATGVAVVTTSNSMGEPLGMTINSFASVSLDPALVLWSIDNASGYIKEFTAAKHFAIHVLTREQETLSNTFAGIDNDRFKLVAWSADTNRTPLLNEYLSRFICTTEHLYAGGDHLIIVGRVTAFEHNVDQQPLLFHSGGYQSLA